MFNISLLLLIFAFIITSEQLNRRTIVDIPLTGLNSQFTEVINKDLDEYDVTRFLGTRQSTTYNYRIRLKHNTNKKKKVKMQKIKYTSCTCQEWKCDRRSGGTSEDGKIANLPKHGDDVIDFPNFWKALHKYNNWLRIGEKGKMRRNCHCLRKVCPGSSVGDLEHEINTHDGSDGNQVMVKVDLFHI